MADEDARPEARTLIAVLRDEGSDAHYLHGLLERRLAENRESMKLRVTVSGMVQVFTLFVLSGLLRDSSVVIPPVAYQPLAALAVLLIMVLLFIFVGGTFHLALGTRGILYSKFGWLKDGTALHKTDEEWAGLILDKMRRADDWTNSASSSALTILTFLSIGMLLAVCGTYLYFTFQL
ncbi:MAG: hypothetical protein ACK5JR_03805 [Tropicimonas sp.]|uniref:hypothetical protein n=1 Tax=Tropicimonas sp. TaxID=2067044 RepID=UPI003A86DB8F